MSAYATQYPLVPYDALQAGVIPNDVYGIMCTWFANRVPLQSRLRKLPIGSPTFLVTNDQFRPRSLTLSANYTTGSSTRLTFADATSFDLGDVLQVDSELFLVTATHATTPTVTGAYGGTTGANHTSTTPVYLITNTRTGAEINISGLSRNPVTITQTNQTIQHSYSVGGSLATTANYVSGEGNPVDRERMMNAQNSLDDFESAMYGTTAYTSMVSYGSSSGARPMMKGIQTLIVTNRTTSPTNSAAYKLNDLSRDTFQKCFDQGGNPTLLLVSTDWLSGLLAWGGAVQRTSPGNNEFGTPINRFTVPFLNDLEIVPAPLLRPGSCLCLSESEVRIRMKRELREIPRGSRGDAFEGDWIMEGAVELDNESHHAYVTGITGFAAS